MSDCPSRKDIIDAIDFMFAEIQGRVPPLYEDGYSDACAEAKKRIGRLFGSAAQAISGGEE